MLWYWRSRIWRMAAGAGRMDRQAILFREDPTPPRVHALLDEQVLHRNVGGPAAMAEQLEHLVELAMMPRISVQVIPADRPNAGLLAFVISLTTNDASFAHNAVRLAL